MADVTDDAGKEIMVTDNSWNCSNTANEGWEKANFQEGNDWHPASCLGKDHYYHRNSQSWPDSPNRRVIWTNSGGDMTVYCRKIMNCKFFKMIICKFSCRSIDSHSHLDGPCSHSFQNMHHFLCIMMVVRR